MTASPSRVMPTSGGVSRVRRRPLRGRFHSTCVTIGTGRYTSRAGRSIFFLDSSYKMALLSTGLEVLARRSSVAIIGAIYPNDAWVDFEAKAVVDEFRRFLPEGTDLISVGTPNPAVDNTGGESVRHAV